MQSRTSKPNTVAKIRRALSKPTLAKRVAALNLIPAPVDEIVRTIGQILSSRAQS